MNIVEAMHWCTELKLGRSPRGRVYHVWRKSPSLAIGHYRYRAIGCRAAASHLKISNYMLPPDNDKPICKKCESEVIFSAQYRRKAYYEEQDRPRR